jgi:hypothetical protein
MKYAASFLAGLFVGVALATPPWATRYLWIGAVLVVAVAFIAVASVRRSS